MPLGHGNVLAAYLVDSKSNVATAGDLAVLGNGTIYGTRYIKSGALSRQLFSQRDLWP